MEMSPMVSAGLGIGSYIAGTQLAKLWPNLATIAYMAALYLSLKAAHESIY